MADLIGDKAGLAMEFESDEVNDDIDYEERLLQRNGKTLVIIPSIFRPVWCTILEITSDVMNKPHAISSEFTDLPPPIKHSTTLDMFTVGLPSILLAHVMDFSTSEILYSHSSLGNT